MMARRPLATARQLAAVLLEDHEPGQPGQPGRPRLSGAGGKRAAGLAGVARKQQPGSLAAQAWPADQNHVRGVLGQLSALAEPAVSRDVRPGSRGSRLESDLRSDR